MLSVFTWFLILGKIKNGSQDGEYVWWCHRPLAAPMRMPIKCRTTEDNNDLNQVVASSGFSENKGLGGVLSRWAHKTRPWSFLFKDFLKYASLILSSRKDQRLSAKGKIFSKNCNMSKTSERGSINPLSLPLKHKNFYCKFLQLYSANYLCKLLTYHFPNSSLLIIRPSFQWLWRIFSNSSVTCQKCKKNRGRVYWGTLFLRLCAEKGSPCSAWPYTWKCERFLGQCRAKTIPSPFIF